MTTVSRQEVLSAAVRTLRDAGVDSPELSAQVLLAFVLGCSRVELFLERSASVPKDKRARFRKLVGKRAHGEPVAYLTGEREFFGLEFEVRPGVLIPRPETELLIERVRDIFDSGRALRFVDLGTGSGIIAVLVGTLFSGASGLAVDISAAALEVAGRNVRAHGLGGRIFPVMADLAAPPLPAQSLDLVTSNPPYLSAAEVQEVSREVRDFEPKRALVAGPEGTELLEVLARRGGALLRPGGVLLVEMGHLQGERARKIFSGWAEVRIHRDLAGKDRLIEAWKK
jgi:release factor glutamine methyltransferase